jgi:hypothetical protein
MSDANWDSSSYGVWRVFKGEDELLSVEDAQFLPAETN